jgi:carboxylesterase type B
MFGCSILISQLDALSDLLRLRAFHTSDIPWLFGADRSYYQSFEAPNCTWSQSDNAFSREIITMWTNFARTGCPTSDNSWLRYNLAQANYLNLKADNIQLLQHVRLGYVCDFWDAENDRFSYYLHFRYSINCKHFCNSHY